MPRKDLGVGNVFKALKILGHLFVLLLETYFTSLDISISPFIPIYKEFKCPL